MITIIEMGVHGDMEGLPPGASIVFQGTTEELEALWSLLSSLPGPVFVHGYAQANDPAAEARMHIEPLSWDKDGPPVMVVTFTGQPRETKAPQYGPNEIFVGFRHSSTTPGVRSILIAEKIATLMTLVDMAEGEHVSWWEIEENAPAYLRGYVSKADPLFPNGGRWRIHACVRDRKGPGGGGNGYGPVYTPGGV